MDYRNAFTRAMATSPRVYKVARTGYFLATQPRRMLRQAYRRLRHSGIFFEESELYMCSLFPKAILDLVIERFRPTSVLDVGAGIGRSLEYFLDNGIDALGIEGSRL